MTPSVATRARSTAAPTFLALSCVGAFACGSAHAADRAADAHADPDPQVRADGQTREDILVNGERQRGAKDVASPVNTPRSVVVLPEKIIEQTGSATLQDALRTVPGITFGAAEGGNPIGDRPFIRGFDSQGSTFVDSVRDFSAQTREVFAVDQIQIVRGSDSTLGGRGSAGGTINIISKLPINDNFARAALSYGSDDYKRVTVDVNGKLSDTVAARIQGMWHDQDVAGRDALYQRRWGVAPSVTVGIGTPTKLTASYYYLETHELPDTGIPYLYNLANAPLGETFVEPAIGDVTTIAGATGHVDRSVFYGLKSRDFRDTTTHQATLRAEHDFGGITLRNTSRYTHNTQAYIYTQPDDQQGNVFGTNPATPATAGGMVWRRANTRHGYADALVNQTDLFGTVDTGGVKHSFAVGAEVSWEKARRGAYVLATGSTNSPRCTDAAFDRFNCTSLFNPNPNDPWINYAGDTSTVTAPIEKGATSTEIQNEASTKAVYAFDSITLADALILNLGVRYDHFKTTQKGAGAVVVPIKRSDDLFNWQAGLVFKPTANASLYASYATSATPPNSLLGEGSESNGLSPGRGETLLSPDAIKVTKTKSYEVGAKADLFGGRLALNLAAFQTETDNARTTGPDGFVEYIGETRIRGVELTANGTILPGWTVFGGYTYLDPKITNGGFTKLTAAAVGGQAAQTVLVPSTSTGRQVSNVAKHSATLWTNVEFGRFSIGGGAFYTSRVFGGYQDDRSARQDGAGNVTVVPATKTILRSIPGYVRFDARAGVKITDAVDLSVNVQNLTNKTYFNQAYTAHYASIAPGRSAFATLNLRY
ncbi:catecholate siderophore receptor [Hephaestia caeni]|uniref:Catecholate siderophore receptor n=1 Tax=Hephaestia caeni TaxID=645617 RepID=A0A397NH27_9SPHN|nr:TonB-dependent receptor [Hephaestia caeni]RIA36832.1 catecholate siderophore receptor [Hephaestia caeni]